MRRRCLVPRLSVVRAPAFVRCSIGGVRAADEEEGRCRGREEPLHGEDRIGAVLRWCLEAVRPWKCCILVRLPSAGRVPPRCPRRARRRRRCGRSCRSRRRADDAAVSRRHVRVVGPVHAAWAGRDPRRTRPAARRPLPTPAGALERVDRAARDALGDAEASLDTVHRGRGQRRLLRLRGRSSERDLPPRRRPRHSAERRPVERGGHARRNARRAQGRASAGRGEARASDGTLNFLNKAPGKNGIALFTSDWGASTPRVAGAFAVVLGSFPPATPNTDLAVPVVATVPVELGANRAGHGRSRGARERRREAAGRGDARSGRHAPPHPAAGLVVGLRRGRRRAGARAGRQARVPRRTRRSRRRSSPRAIRARRSASARTAGSCC